MDNIFNSGFSGYLTQAALQPSAIATESQRQTITSLADQSLFHSFPPSNHSETVQVLEQTEFNWIDFNALIGISSGWAIAQLKKQYKGLLKDPSLFLDIVNRLNSSTQKATHLERIHGIYHKFSKKLLAQEDFKSALDLAVFDAKALPKERISEWVNLCNAIRKAAPVEMKDAFELKLMTGCLVGLEQHGANDQIKSLLFDMARTAQKIDDELIPGFYKAFKLHLEGLNPEKRADEASWMSKIIPLPFYNELTQLKDIINSDTDGCDSTVSKKMVSLLQSYTQRSDYSKNKLLEALKSCYLFFNDQLTSPETWEALGLIAINSSITESEVAFNIAKHIIDGYSPEISPQTALLICRLLAPFNSTEKVVDTLLNTVLPVLCKSSDIENRSMAEKNLKKIQKKPKNAIRCSSLFLDIYKPKKALLILNTVTVCQKDLESRRALLVRAAVQSLDECEISQTLEILSKIGQVSESLKIEVQKVILRCSQILCSQETCSQGLSLLQKYQTLFEQYSTSVSCVPLLELLIAQDTPETFSLAYKLAIRLKPNDSKIWHCIWNKLRATPNKRRITDAWKVFSQLTLEGEAISECSKNALEIAADEAVYNDINTSKVLLSISGQKEMEMSLTLVLKRARATAKSWNGDNLNALNCFFERLTSQQPSLTPFLLNYATVVNGIAGLDILAICIVRACLQNQNPPLTHAQCDMVTSIMVNIQAESPELTESRMYAVLEAISNSKLKSYNWIPALEFFINCQMIKAHSMSIGPMRRALVFLAVVMQHMKLNEVDANSINWVSDIGETLTILSSCAPNISVFAKEIFIPFCKCLEWPLQAEPPIPDDVIRHILPLCLNLADNLKNSLHIGPPRMKLGRRYLLTQCVITLNIMLSPEAEERKVLTDLIHHLLPTSLTDCKSHSWTREWLTMPNNGIPLNLQSLIPINKGKVLDANKIITIIKNQQCGNLVNTSYLFKELIPALITARQWKCISECYQFIAEQIDELPLPMQIQCMHSLHEVIKAFCNYFDKPAKSANVRNTLTDMVSSTLSVIKEALRSNPSNPHIFHIAMLKFDLISCLKFGKYQLNSDELYQIILNSAPQVAHKRSFLDAMTVFASAVSFHKKDEGVECITKLIKVLPTDTIPNRTAICAIYSKTPMSQIPLWSKEHKRILNSLWDKLPHEEAIENLLWLSCCLDNSILPRNWESINYWMKKWNNQALSQLTTHSHANETKKNASSMLLFIKKSCSILQEVLLKLPEQQAETTISLWQATLKKLLEAQTRYSLQAYMIRVFIDTWNSIEREFKDSRPTNVTSNKKK